MDWTRAMVLALLAALMTAVVIVAMNARPGELLHVCIGPADRMKVVDGPEDCNPSQTHKAWVAFEEAASSILGLGDSAHDVGDVEKDKNICARDYTPTARACTALDAWLLEPPSRPLRGWVMSQTRPSTLVVEWAATGDPTFSIRPSGAGGRILCCEP